MYISKRKFCGGLLFVYAVTCFLQAQTLKINLAGINIAFNRIILVFFLLDFASSLIKKRGRLPYFRGNYYTFLCVWLAWQAVNVIFGMTNGISGWINLTWRIIIFVVSAFALRKYITSLDLLYRFLKWVQAGMIIQIFIGMYEHITGIYHWTIYKEMFESVAFYMTKRYPCAMQTNPNDFALLMYFAILVSFVLLEAEQNKISKCISLSTIALSTYLIIISDSRSVLLGLIIAIISYFLFLILLRKKLKRGLLLSILVVLPLFAAYVAMNFESFAGKLSFDFTGSSESARMDMIVYGLKNAIFSYGMGTGVHGFAYHFFLVEILAECGIIVFVWFLVTIFRLYKSLKKIGSASNFARTRSVARVLRAGLVGYLITSIAPAISLNIEWLGLMIGIFAVFCSIAEGTGSEK